MKTIQRIILTWAMVMLTTIITMPNAYANDQAAIVIVTEGDFYAVNKQQEKRQLQRRSKVFVGDTLVTGEKGRAQVRFIDGAVISLRPDSELNIQKYSYGKAKSDEGSLMTLIKGGFRTITGAIGKQKYKVITSLATIGIRGTHYEAVINNNQLYVALWDGGVTLTNNAGKLDLGLGADYNFGMVQNLNIQPQGQIDPPAVIVNETQPQIAPDLSKNSGSSSSPTKAADSPSLVLKDGWSDASADTKTISSTTDSGTAVVNVPTTGTASYAKVASISASGTTSTISSFVYNATVDFAAATVNGTMSFVSNSGSSDHSWNISFNGGPGTSNGVSGKDFSMNVNTAASTVDTFDPVSGTISGSFAGSNAEQMAGSFNVANTNNSSVNAQGTFTATQ